MSRPYQGVIVPLESFIEKVRLPTAGYVALRYSETSFNSRKLSRLTEILEYLLIVKLLEDQFLLHVMPRHGQMPWIPSTEMTSYLSNIKQRAPDYEVLFGRCFHSHMLGMRNFPDDVYLDKLNDSVVVTWKKE